MRTEKEKMCSGELYSAADSELVSERLKARLLTKEFGKAINIGNYPGTKSKIII